MKKAKRKMGERKMIKTLMIKYKLKQIVLLKTKISSRSNKHKIFHFNMTRT